MLVSNHAQGLHHLQAETSPDLQLQYCAVPVHLVLFKACQRKDDWNKLQHKSASFSTWGMELQVQCKIHTVY
jgi:hypothetical protein